MVMDMDIDTNMDRWKTKGYRTLNMEHGIWNMEYGIWNMEQAWMD
jgi:hypothetical protein